MDRPEFVSIVLAYRCRECTLKNSFSRDKLLRYSDLAYRQLRDTAKRTFWIYAKPNMEPNPLCYCALFIIIENVDDKDPVLDASFDELLGLYDAALTICLDMEIGQRFILDPINEKIGSVILTADDIQFVWRTLNQADKGWSPIDRLPGKLLDIVLQELIYCIMYGVYDYSPCQNGEMDEIEVVVMQEPGLMTLLELLTKEMATSGLHLVRSRERSTTSSRYTTESSTTGATNSGPSKQGTIELLIHGPSPEESITRQQRGHGGESVPQPCRPAEEYGSLRWSTETLTAWSDESFKANPLSNQLSATGQLWMQCVEFDQSKSRLGYHPLLIGSESDLWSTTGTLSINGVESEDGE